MARPVFIRTSSVPRHSGRALAPEAMLYFFIVPAYVLLVVGLIAAAIVARFVPRFQPASGYIVAGTLGTVVGFTIVNAVVIVLGVLPVWLAEKLSFPDWLRHITTVVVTAALFVGPFVGSAIGVLSGFAAGAYLVYRHRKHAGSPGTCRGRRERAPVTISAPVVRRY